MIEVQPEDMSDLLETPKLSGEAVFANALVAQNVIDMASASRVLSAAEQTGESVCQLLSKLGILEEKKVAILLAEHLNLPLLAGEDIPLDVICRQSLSDDFVKLQHILPLRINENQLDLAVADPFRKRTLQAVELACEKRVSLVIGEVSQIETAYRQLYETASENLAATGTEDQGSNRDLEQLKELAAEAPVIRFVNRLIQNAVDLCASDIHLEPFAQTFQARLRIDGVLRNIDPPPVPLQAAIISRIKLMAALNIAERRLPQDGRLRATVRGKFIDLRVSTTPTMHGESIVLRILDKGVVQLDLEKLGFGSHNLQSYLRALDRPTGVVLVTGPTGSGKTTTLYASLLRFNDGERKILTIEDPIEYELPGVNQVQVKSQIGLGFAHALRSFLRQDPDIMLVGEIRDLETAEVASQAALTGHKVLSTLHTNDAASSITRLLDMGLPDFIVAATLEGVVAQRLVRILCQYCKRPGSPTPEMLRHFEEFNLPNPPHVFHQAGCAQCAMTGFRGRIGVYEVLVMQETIRRLIYQRADLGRIQTEAIHQGMQPMFKDGLMKVSDGLTTIDELLRACRQGW